MIDDALKDALKRFRIREQAELQRQEMLVAAFKELIIVLRKHSDVWSSQEISELCDEPLRNIAKLL